MFSFVKEKLKKIYDQFTSKATALFSRQTIDQDFIDELTQLLICSDTGVETTNKIIEHLKNSIKNKTITDPKQIKIELEQQLLSMISIEKPKTTPAIIMLVGINGTGKTTFAGKLANKLKKNNKKILLVAGDTFRAAATEQLGEWAKKIGVDVHIGKPNQDPASVVFDGCQKFISDGYDHIIIDTAGRLQTKVNLMKELTKIRKIISKKLPNTQAQTWLVLDSMLGQNSLDQAKIFNEATDLDGIILTKLDGTGKGGIIFAITNQLHLPIIYVTFGEEVDALKDFDTQEYVKNLLG